MGLSFLVVFLAELGDKSQLLALGMATRYRAWVVISGLALASAAVQGLSVAVGLAVGAALPGAAVGVGGGLLFLGFAWWTWRHREADPDEAEPGPPTPERLAVLIVAAGIVVAELGDKTMLATITLAAREPALGVWLGASLGMLTAGVAAAVVGRALGSRLSERMVAVSSTAMFVGFGTWLLIDALLG